MVHRSFCEGSKKPKPIRRMCNLQECSQPLWAAEEWEHCTKTCGGSGYQLRTVRCVQPLHGGANRSVHFKYCSRDRPESRRPCNRVPCPAWWKAGPWSECSVTCGEGTETRQITCRGGEQCDGEKPESVRVCKLAPCNGLTQNLHSRGAWDCSHLLVAMPRAPSSAARPALAAVLLYRTCI